MTDEEVLQSKNDLEMIRREWLWPGRNLCLKRHVGRDTEFAVIVSSEEPVTIRVGAREPLRTEVYPSIAHLVADGWLVD